MSYTDIEDYFLDIVANVPAQAKGFTENLASVILDTIARGFGKDIGESSSGLPQWDKTFKLAEWILGHPSWHSLPEKVRNVFVNLATDSDLRPKDAYKGIFYGVPLALKDAYNKGLIPTEYIDRAKKIVEFVIGGGKTVIEVGIQTGTSWGTRIFNWVSTPFAFLWRNLPKLDTITNLATVAEHGVVLYWAMSSAGKDDPILFAVNSAGQVGIETTQVLERLNKSFMNINLTMAWAIPSLFILNRFYKKKKRHTAYRIRGEDLVEIAV